MKKQYEEIIFAEVVLDAAKTITLTEICQRFAIDDQLIHDMIEHGLIDPYPSEDALLSQKTLRHIQIALHLHHDLGINIAGSALVVEMLDELETARRELAILQRHFD